MLLVHSREQSPLNPACTEYLKVDKCVYTMFRQYLVAGIYILSVVLSCLWSEAGAHKVYH